MVRTSRSRLSTKKQIVLNELMPWQNQVKREAGRFNVLCCGRRAGKTALGVDIIANSILQDRKPVAWFSPTYKMLSEVWRELKYALQPIISRISEQEHRIETYTGGTVEMWSLESHDTIRGRKYKLAFIDEAAMVSDLGEAWNMVIRPALADYHGSAWFASTPKGLNYFHNLWMMADNDSNWKRWRFPTSSNSYISEDELAALKKLPELVVRQEIEADFVSLEGAVFRRIDEAAKLFPLSAPLSKHTYIAGVDVAASVDFTVVSIIDSATKEMVFMDRFNRVDYNVLIDRLEAAYKRWNLSSMKIEANSIGQPVIDQLIARRMNIIPFTTTSATKQTIIQNLQAAFENGEIKILNDPVLIGELLSFESKRNASGSFSYSAPEGMHDDCVMSLAIAWDAVSNIQWAIYGGE
jgi:phage terminase large subunit-like protein